VDAWRGAADNLDDRRLLDRARDNVHNLDDFVAQAPFPFLLTALVIFAFGPGLLSIDGLLKYTIFAKHIHPRQLPVP